MAQSIKFLFLLTFHCFAFFAKQSGSRIKNIILILLHFAFISNYAQRNCVGVLLDSITIKPIEFANTGIIGKGFGSVTNEKGEFNFTIPDSLLTDPVKVSMIGYISKTISFSKLTAKSILLLSQDATNLHEVIVSAKKTKTKILLYLVTCIIPINKLLCNNKIV